MMNHKTVLTSICCTLNDVNKTLSPKPISNDLEIELEVDGCTFLKMVCHAVYSGGQRFTAIMAAKSRGVVYQRWNSKINLVFGSVILTEILMMQIYKDIRRGLAWRIYMWEQGRYMVILGIMGMRGRTGRGGFPIGRISSIAMRGDYMKW